MPTPPASVEAYLDSLPEDRREAIATVRAVVNEHLPEGYEEGISYGMIGWFVPHRLYPAGYHCDPRQPLPFASLASQKRYMSLYLMCIYGDEGQRRWFEEAWAETGRKLDMGKSCMHFRRVEDLALEVIGEAVARVPVAAFVAHYEKAIPASKRRKKT